MQRARAGNPFVVETINLSALKAHADDTRDIVPANGGDIFPDGQNASAANLALLANKCVAAVVPPVVIPGDETPGDETPRDETPGDETPGDETPGGEIPGGETPGDETPGDETPGSDTTPVLDVTPLANNVVVPAAKEPSAAAKKTNVGYSVQTAVGRTPEYGIPLWLAALTGVFTAGAAMVLWQGGRRARISQD